MQGEYDVLQRWVSTNPRPARHSLNSLCQLSVGDVTNIRIGTRTLFAVVPPKKVEYQNRFSASVSPGGFYRAVHGAVRN